MKKKPISQLNNLEFMQNTCKSFCTETFKLFKRELKHVSQSLLCFSKNGDARLITNGWTQSVV